MEITLAVIGATLLLSWIALHLYIHHYRRHDVSPAAYPWPKDVDDEELDGIVDGLMARMSLQEKVEQLSGDGGFPLLIRLGAMVLLYGRFPNMYAGRNERRGIPPLSFSDGPRGVVVGKATCFPVAMARGASWDVELEARVGDALGQEVRAVGANYFGGLCINLLRHPGWGRAQETYGEDPHHLGEMGVALLTAVQRHNVMACAKHFALNSIENSRFYVDVTLDDRTAHEVYLPHFRCCVDAGVASVMSAYNKARGRWCGHSDWLLDEVLRRDWGFEGFVTSDWLWGIHDTVEPALAGMDVEMPRTKHYGRKLLAAVRDGSVPTSVIDRNARRVVRTKLRTVTRDDPQAYPRELIACDRHRALAREAAEKSMVLLRNDGDVLPFDCNAVRKLAVIGELAEAPNTGDRGSSRVSPPDVVTFLDGLREFLGDRGEVVFDRGRDLDRARAAADGADAVVLVVGRRPDDEGENLNSNHRPGESRRVSRGGDRDSLRLRPSEEALIADLAPRHANCVVVLVGGSAIVVEPWRASAPAILMAWYPGMAGGTALARILFGEVNPSGRLPFTVPVDSSQLPPFDPAAPTAEYGYFHGYTWMENQRLRPAYPFGFGLSYTRFAFEALELEQPEIPIDGEVVARVTVRNVGERVGSVVAQCYVGFPESAVERPAKLLRGFTKVSLDPGESHQLTLRVPARSLAWFDPASREWVVESVRHTLWVGSSSDDTDLHRVEFRLVDSG